MTISKSPPYINVKSVTARIWLDKTPKEIHITSRTVDRSILALAMAQEKGITALEMSSWAFRLGAYIHILKRDNHLDIETLREEHPHGWHGRYVLHTPIEILRVETQ